MQPGGVVYFNKQMHACACVPMVENEQKLFSSCVWEAHVRLMCKYKQKWSFLAFRSDSQMLVDTLKLVAPERFWVNSTSFAHIPMYALHEPLIRMIKKSMFLIILKHFYRFLAMQTHAQACVRWSKYTRGSAMGHCIPTSPPAKITTH